VRAEACSHVAQDTVRRTVTCTTMKVCVTEVCEKFLDQLSHCQFLKADSVTCG
jgi:hypothetical protein